MWSEYELKLYLWSALIRDCPRINGSMCVACSTHTLLCFVCLNCWQLVREVPVGCFVPSLAHEKLIPVVFSFFQNLDSTIVSYSLSFGVKSWKKLEWQSRFHVSVKRDISVDALFWVLHSVQFFCKVSLRAIKVFFFLFLFLCCKPIQLEPSILFIFYWMGHQFEFKAGCLSNAWVTLFSMRPSHRKLQQKIQIPSHVTSANSKGISVCWRWTVGTNESFIRSMNRHSNTQHS